MVKPSKISLFGTKKLMTLKLGIQHRVLKYYQMFSNHDTGLTMTIFMTCEYVREVVYIFNDLRSCFEDNISIIFSKYMRHANL